MPHHPARDTTARSKARGGGCGCCFDRPASLVALRRSRWRAPLRSAIEKHGRFSFAPLDSVSAIYMLPVLIAAVRYGTGPAVMAALLGALMTTLFYPPLFSVLVFEPPQIIDLTTSLVVALTVGQLAGKLRRQMLQATEREQTIRRIYELSSTLAIAADVEAVYRIVAEQ